jgi:hypothetical protein
LPAGLLGAAQLWMDAALEVERTWALMENDQPVAVKNERRP